MSCLLHSFSADVDIRQGLEPQLLNQHCIDDFNALCASALSNPAV